MFEKDVPCVFPADAAARMTVSSNLAATTASLIASGMDAEKAATTAFELYADIDNYIRKKTGSDPLSDK
ncbi:MAG: hypothetical protein CL942_14170 [Desulfovibrio sp.]|nr:hypothetical protein [Desulfovibrio sp.]|tara:strand:- start:6536 stop:6742 length:207 start_codon:yes stop_codon:yes gene_type:complete